MRYINTNNKHVELVESDESGKILSSRGFMYGQLYYQIKNGKVSFYLLDSETPYRNDVWSIDIPFIMNGETIATEEEAGESLAEIMDDSYQEQLDELKEGLAAEEARAATAEDALDTKIDNESARAISAETNIQSEITSMSATVATFDTRIQSCENQVSAVTNTVNAEVTRATAKDAEHDTAISGLNTSLQSEVSRALSAETEIANDLDAEIVDRQADVDAEEARAISAETGLHNDIVAERDRALAAESGITANLNAEVSRATTRENAIDDKVDAEVTRATAKDTEHDSLISGLTNNLASEVSRALSAETEIANDLDQEIADRAADVNAEETRALAAESALTDAINAEVTRSTNKDASQDSLISGLSTSIQNEITRATGAENSLRSDLNAEVSARTTADAAQLQRITALEVGKADANSVYTKQESDDKYATKEYMSGFSANYYDKNATNALLDAKADKANAVASAEYLSNNKIINFKNISGTVISSIDATAFIKDGMVDTVSISGSNLVITFNTDAGKEPISIPLTDIFDPSNYYTKAETDTAINSATSGKVETSTFNTLSGRVDTISGDVATVSGSVETVKQEIVTISGESVTTGEVQTMIDSAVSGKADSNNVYSKTESDNKYQLKGDYVTGAQMSAFTYDKQAIDTKIGQGGTFDPTQYYNKTQTNALLDLKADTANTYAKSEVNGLVADKADATALTQVNNALTAHTSDANVHVTSSEKSTWNAKQNALTPGHGISIQNDVISVTATSPTVDAYTKAESDAKFATITNFNSHSGNTNIHVTASEKQLWNNKSDFSGSYNDLTNKPTIPNYTAGSGITISNNVISAKIWQGTQSQYDALTSKDNDTIYLVY